MMMVRPPVLGGREGGSAPQTECGDLVVVCPYGPTFRLESQDAERMGSFNVHMPMNASFGTVYAFVVGTAKRASVLIFTRPCVCPAFDELIKIA